MRFLRVIVLAVTSCLMLVGQASWAAACSRQPTALAAARSATAKYHSLSAAKADGYSILADTAGITCIAEPGMGAMGVHYVNGDVVGNPAIKATRPEALVYAPDKHGRLHLAALEYVVIKSDWDAGHSQPPKLFGRTFDFTDAPNRYGLPPFYSLHAWIWKHNPAGMFAMWNPEVHCP